MKFSHDLPTYSATTGLLSFAKKKSFLFVIMCIIVSERPKGIVWLIVCFSALACMYICMYGWMDGCQVCVWAVQALYQLLSKVKGRG